MRSVLKNKVLVTIIAILLLANIAMLVFFISGMRNPERGNSESRKPAHSTESFLQNKLGFSEQQITKFNQLKEEHHQKLTPLFEDLRITKDQFFLLTKDSLSGSSVDSAAVMIGEKQKTLDMQVFRTIRDVRNLCTPQQQLKFDSLLPKIAYKVVWHIRRGNPKEDSLKRPN
jgi:periplasmic protein CpxP/Spy